MTPTPRPSKRARTWKRIILKVEDAMRSKRPYMDSDHRLSRAVTGAFVHGRLSFTECDEAFRLAPGESERVVREHMLGRAYIAHRLKFTESVRGRAPRSQRVKIRRARKGRAKGR